MGQNLGGALAGLSKGWGNMNNTGWGVPPASNVGI
jgi:hypothetical protein